jgi:hypothetical protein
MVADLLVVADLCIETLEVQAQPLESRNNLPPMKKQQEDREVNAADRANQM